MLLAALLATAVAAQDIPLPRARPTGVYHTLTTGNGHGFQLYDARERRLTAFLDHPYRYVEAPADLTKDGPERRNLLERFALSVGGRSLETWRQAEAGYEDETNVIRAEYELEKARSEAFYFSPFGVERNALVVLARVPPGAPGAAGLGLRLGAAPKSEDIMRQTMAVVPIPGERLQELASPRAWVQTGNGRGALVYLPLSPAASIACRATPATAAPAPDRLGGAPSVCAGDAVDVELALPSNDGWFGFSVAYVDDAAQAPAAASELAAWAAGRPPAALRAAALAEWERWRVKPSVTFRGAEERKLWRQSEAVLRMGQVREPNLPAPGLRVNNGMMLASLAPGHWATGWVRDAAYATAALARMGHYQEAKASLSFFLNAEPVGGFKKYAQDADYRISVTRYYGSGQEEADHSGDPAPNVELDGWGLFLWAARQYVDSSGDVAWLSEKTRQGSVYEAMLDGVARAIEKNLETLSTGVVMRPDSSIWEVHDDHKKHFAFTTLMAARGLADFAVTARKFGRQADADKYEKLAAQVRDGFTRTFGTRDGLVGALEPAKDTDVDGAVIEALSLGVVDPNSPLGRATLARKIEKLRLPTGGYKRNGGDDPYAVNEWVFIDLRLASALYRARQPAKAGALIQRNVQKAAANHRLLPEELVADPKQGRLGDYHGSVPMVGYGAGVYALSVLDRELYAPKPAAPAKRRTPPREPAVIR